MPGPAPKRSDERRRRNTPAAGPVQKVDVEAQPGAEDEGSLAWLVKQPIVIPEPPDPSRVDDADDDQPAKGGWHPTALLLWESIQRSGQALFYEPSDWAAAYLLCESISRDLKPQVVGVAPASEFGPAEVVRERIPLKGSSLSAYLKAFGSLMLLEGDRRRLSIELERARDEKPGSKGDGKVVKITDRRQARLVAQARREAEGE